MIVPLLDDASDTSIEHLPFLFDAYVVACFWWELVECAKKLLMTGLLTFVFGDEVAQLAIGMLVTLASGMLLHTYRPYADHADQFFALAVGWQLVLVMFVGIVMGLNTHEQDDAAREQCVGAGGRACGWWSVCCPNFPPCHAGTRCC